MRRINRCLNAPLAKLCYQTLKLDDLNVRVQQYLPENLKTHCVVGSFHNGCLLLVTHDSVWASQLRYAQPQLRERLRSEGGLYQLASIKISVTSEEKGFPLPKRANQPTISEQARALIHQTADQCDYLPLKSALKQLAHLGPVDN